MIPANKTSRWKIKIYTDKVNKLNKPNDEPEIFIGIGPSNPYDEQNFYAHCWLFSTSNSMLIVNQKRYSPYKGHSGKLSKGDIVEIIVNRNLGQLSFAINGSNYGIAYSKLPKEENLYPIVFLSQEILKVEIT